MQMHVHKFPWRPPPSQTVGRTHATCADAAVAVAGKQSHYVSAVRKRGKETETKLKDEMN
jgi:hypothetical protein